MVGVILIWFLSIFKLDAAILILYKILAAQFFSTQASSTVDRDLTSNYDQLYSGHIWTSFTQKVLLSAGSAVMSITDPYRGGI